MVNLWRETWTKKQVLFKMMILMHCSMFAWSRLLSILEIRVTSDIDSLVAKSLPLVQLGLAAEDPTVAKPAAPVVQEKKSSLPVRPAIKAERMREYLRSLKHNHKDDDAKVKRAFGNVAKNPDEEKFRKIRLTNQSLQDRVGSLTRGRVS